MVGVLISNHIISICPHGAKTVHKKLTCRLQQDSGMLISQNFRIKCSQPGRESVLPFPQDIAKSKECFLPDKSQYLLSLISTGIRSTCLYKWVLMSQPGWELAMPDFSRHRDQSHVSFQDALLGRWITLNATSVPDFERSEQSRQDGRAGGLSALRPQLYGNEKIAGKIQPLHLICLQHINTLDDHRHRLHGGHARPNHQLCAGWMSHLTTPRQSSLLGKGNISVLRSSMKAMMMSFSLLIWQMQENNISF